ncbi:hypothetical protein SF274771_4232 [Shigella flexneri 2747-71]|nr:hypothetical protein SF274771_4232 [Shigella flexneri 2747-71]EGK18126.1 hypothetical protein SFK218_4600 [Shigella flexneri K-218]EIQ22233.1 hypothetical protein SFK404_4533 [Shigella flexneri K-404]EJL11259.1 hypothetical protein SF660363_4055 [Shigella flexneri 6603-63]
MWVEVVVIKRDIGVIQAQRQVAAVALVPAFQLGIGGGFDHSLDKPGLGNVLHVLCSCKLGCLV